MATWGEFERASPELAAAGRHASGVFGLIGPSPKQRDLLRSGLYAAHSFPAPDRDDEFYLRGRAEPRTDSARVAAVRRALVATGATSSGDELCFELLLERALLSEYKPRGEPDNWPPRYRRWRS